MNKALVIGYGSIGQRHARLLKDMGCDVAIVSAHDTEFPQRFSSVRDAVAAWAPDYVVVANETTAHYDAVNALASSGYAGKVLIEKPLFDRSYVFPQNQFSNIAVAYNYRCHPLLLALSQELVGQKAVTAEFRVGQWLPDWRSQIDYRRSSSALRQKGGGVLRDLSHEIDMSIRVFGSWRALTAQVGRFSDLEIETEDSCTLLMEMERCPSVTLVLNYLDRPIRREAIVNTTRHTYTANFMSGELFKDGVLLRRHVLERDEIYRIEHREMLRGNAEALCSVRDAAMAVEIIEGAEKASAGRVWLTRPL